MNEYLLIFRHEKMEAGPATAQMQMVMQQWQSWIAGIAQQGNYSGTNRLLAEGKTIKPNQVITDGPYMEVKEMVGGYLLIKANSLADAMQIAEGCPSLLYGDSVEVRPVMQIDDDPNSKTFLLEKN